MHYVKNLDPVKVAKLDGVAYANLIYAADMINAGTNERDMPQNLHAAAFVTFRKCGMKDLHTWDGMLIAARQVQQMRVIIERLRAYDNLTCS